MNNFSVAVEATATAQNSAGSAAKENSAYMESLAAKVQGLKAAWQELVTDGGMLSKFIKLLIDAGTAILKFANSDLAKLILSFVLLTASGHGITKLFTSLGSGISKLSEIFKAFGFTSEALKYALDGLNASMLKTLGWAALIVALLALAVYVSDTTREFRKLNEEIDKNNQAISQNQSEIDQLNSKPIEDLTEAEKNRLDVLEAQNDALREQNKLKQQQAYEELQKQQTSKFTTVSGGEGVGGGIGTGAVQVTETTIPEFTKNLKTLNGVAAETKEKLANYAVELQKCEEAGVELNEADKEFLETYNQLSAAYHAGTEAASQYGNALGGVVMQQMEQLTAAMHEQNETGEISKATYEKLLKVFPTLGNYVDKTTGKIKLNKNAIQDLVDATSEARNAALQFANGQGAMKIATSATTQEIRNQLVAMEAQALAARSAYVASRLATGDTLREIENSGSAELERLDTAFSKIHDALNRLDNGMLDIVDKTNDYTGGVDDNTDAVDKNTKSTKEQTKELNNAKKAYEKQKKALDDLTESYKNAADAYKIAANYMIEQIDKEIDALEKRKDAINKDYDEQIAKIQETNDEIEKQMALEKAQQALAEAKSKKVLVFKDGKMQYMQDAAAVQEAQANLSALQAQQQQEDEIARLEAERDEALSGLDKQIDRYEKYKEQWENLSTAYEDAQNRLIAQQVLGIKLEGDNWKKRIAQAQKYTTKYNNILQKLGVLEGIKVDVDTGDVTSLKKGTNKIKKSIADIPKIKGFANGTTSTPTGIYKVGEAGTELMIGRGAGVISHNLTENLMKLGQYSPAQWISAIGKSIDRNQTVVQQFGDISLPNVTNASQFVEELKHFNNYAVQATSRR